MMLGEIRESRPEPTRNTHRGFLPFLAVPNLSRRRVGIDTFANDILNGSAFIRSDLPQRRRLLFGQFNLRPNHDSNFTPARDCAIVHLA